MLFTTIVLAAVDVLASMDNVTQQLHAEFGSTNRFSFKNKAQAKQYAQTVLQRKMELEKGFGIPHRNIRFATCLDYTFASYPWLKGSISNLSLIFQPNEQTS